MTGNEQMSNFSSLAYGLMRLLDDKKGYSLKRVREKIDTCLEFGISSFDHADLYGGYTCEEVFGKALKEDSSLRENIQLITKCGIRLLDNKYPQTYIKHYDYSNSLIQKSVDNSLSYFATDYLDLFFIHRPSPLINYEELGRTLDSLVDEKKILAAGVSNFLPHQVQSLQNFMSNKLVSNQIEIHPLKLDAFTDGTLDQCQSLKMRPMSWSPFAGGEIFTARDHRTYQVRQAFEHMCTKYSISLDQCILAWLLKHPTQIIPVLGTNNTDRIKSMTEAKNINLELQDWFFLYKACTGVDVP